MKKRHSNIVNSLCLPYFYQDKEGIDMVSIFPIESKKLRIPASQFQDVTADGGRFHQFYTFAIEEVSNG